MTTYFLNAVEGHFKINTYPSCQAEMTTLADLVENSTADTSLTAVIDYDEFVALSVFEKGVAKIELPYYDIESDLFTYTLVFQVDEEESELLSVDLEMRF